MNDHLQSLDPYFGEVTAVVPTHTAREVDDILGGCVAGRSRWSGDLEERARAISRLGVVLSERVPELAALATSEMGKPVTQGEAEIHKCVGLCEHYARRGPDYLHALPLETSDSRIVVAHRPLGTVLGVMPWNYPFWQALRFVVPTLVAGNTVILRHASNVPRCALAIQQCARDAGIGPEVLSVLFVHRGVLREIIDDPRIDGVSLTGGTRAGRAIGAAAGHAVKPAVLELGGSDAFIVLDDADVAHAARVGVRARFQNGGQSCIAAKRFLVHEAVYEDFRAAFVAAVETLRVGDPRDRATDIGPLAKRSIVEDALGAVADAASRGARTLVDGGEVSEGCLMRPFVLDEVDGSMWVSRREVFGPVASLRRIADVDDAVRLANDTEFGLGASVWTENESRAARAARELRCGMVSVNDMVASSAGVPFGGTKQSGFGRELGRDGALAFVNRQSVRIARSAARRGLAP